MAVSSSILQFYRAAFEEEGKELGYEDLPTKLGVLLETDKNAKEGGFLKPLNYYLHLLERNKEAALFPYLSLERKRELLRELRATYLLLLAQQRYELSRQKFENVHSYQEYLKQCAELIDILNQKSSSKFVPNQLVGLDGRPVKYLGLLLGSVMADKMVESSMDSKTKTILEGINLFNQKRLYWVWGSSLLGVVLSGLPSDFFNTTQAIGAMGRLSPITGALSWILYYFRFGMHLTLFLEHAIAGPWMSKEEKKIPWTQRFKTQWQQRKFNLLNDSLWATCNLACFFWLTAKAGLGPWGDLLTIGLLALDISLAAWNFAEQETQHNKEMLDYEEDIRRLKGKIAAAQRRVTEDKLKHEKELKNYYAQLHLLLRAQKKCKKDWDLKKLSLINDLCYSVGLLIAFVLLTAPFFPLPSQVLFAVVVTGAVLCFTFSVVYNGISSGLEMSKGKDALVALREDHALKIAEFQELVKKNPNLEDNEKKLLYLEIKKIRAQTQHQKKIALYNTMRFARSILIEALFPSLVFVSLVFLNLGVGLGIIGVVLVLAFLSNWLLDAVYKPKDPSPIVFNADEYKKFSQDPEGWALLGESKYTFFEKAQSNKVDSGAALDQGPNPSALWHYKD